jgi:hypothetical protein
VAAGPSPRWLPATSTFSGLVAAEEWWSFFSVLELGFRNGKVMFRYEILKKKKEMWSLSCGGGKVKVS